MNNCNIKIDQEKHHSKIKFLKNGNYMFQYNWKTDILWCSFDTVWSIFEQQFEMSYQDQQHFILDKVEKYFNFRPFTALQLLFHWI